MGGPAADVAAVARVNVRAAAAGVRRLDVGLSDVATILVSDSFGGWGVMARFPDPSGLEVTPGR